MTIDVMRVNEKKKEWFVDQLLKWGEINFHSYPWRNCEEPIIQLISEILLQRTKAEQVIDVFQEIHTSYPNLNSLASLSLDAIKKLIFSLGLHWRAKKLYELFKTIKQTHNGEVPSDFDSLLMLSGVGPYVANAYLSLHRGIRRSIIDSNIVRIYGRYFGFNYDGETRRKKWLRELANSLTPIEQFRKYNYALLDFARELCLPKPRCAECTLRKKCIYWLRIRQP